VKGSAILFSVFTICPFVRLTEKLSPAGPARPTAWFKRSVRGGLRNQCMPERLQGTGSIFSSDFSGELNNEQTNIVGGRSETNLLSKYL
jgi:hypothetical protein